MITGTESGEGLRTLREKFRAAELVSFVADIATATKLDRVVIEAMDVRELAGKPERFEYALTLREFIAPPRSQSVIETQPTGTQTSDQTVNEAIDEDADQANADQVNNIVNALGTLEVQVELEDGGDFSSLRVVVEGETTSGESISTWSQDQENGLYRFEGIQEGTYTVQVELQ
ncbi:MAG: hypothetical protein HC936_02340 [Leptolyngbyaceae cyanobacterium SU_3_3]|nr:hypothetical protein [Leptolyngbyaceae cyanobacterium SU_3_3]